MARHSHHHRTPVNGGAEAQKRVITVVGDEMRVTNPTAAIGRVSYVIWKRVK